MDNLLVPIDLSDSTNQAITNLTDPTTKNAGQTFGDIWYLVFGGISHAADKRRMKYAHDLEQYRQELDASIAQIPDNKRVEPSIQITAQALENSKYCVSSRELREMFVKLISGTMHCDFAADAHPSFPEILKQMSSTDARLLQDFKISRSRPIVDYITKNANGSTKTFAQYVYMNISGNDFEDYSTSISSLHRLGLISIKTDEWLSNENLYEPFKKSLRFQIIESILKSQNIPDSLDIKKGFCKLTPLGEQFIKVCLP